MLAIVFKVWGSGYPRHMWYFDDLNPVVQGMGTLEARSTLKAVIPPAIRMRDGTQRGPIPWVICADLVTTSVPASVWRLFQDHCTLVSRTLALHRSAALVKDLAQTSHPKCLFPYFNDRDLYWEPVNHAPKRPASCRSHDVENLHLRIIIVFVAVHSFSFVCSVSVRWLWCSSCDLVTGSDLENYGRTFLSAKTESH